MSEQQRPAIPTSVILAIAAARIHPDAITGAYAWSFRKHLLSVGVTWIQELIDITRDGEQWITKHRMTLAHAEQREVLSLDWFGVGAGYNESIVNARETFAAAQLGDTK